MRPHKLTMMLGILGIIGLVVAYETTTRFQQFTLFWGAGSSQHRVVYTRAEHPELFTISAVSSFVVGLLALGGALYMHFGLRLRRR